jgi:hypothetical protein
MTDDISLEAQSHKIQKIAHEIINEGMPLNEQFQVPIIVDDKLPPNWKDFMNLFRHKTKEISLESLITCLRLKKKLERKIKKYKVLVVYQH